MSNYEVMPVLVSGNDQSEFQASWTPNNGIKLMIRDPEFFDDGWLDFFFSHEQAGELGEALIRWSKDSH